MYTKTLCILIITLAGLIPLSAQTGLTQKVQVVYERLPLQDILTDLSDRYGLQFSYSDEFVPLKQRISYRSAKRPLKEVLDVLCRRAGLIYLEAGGMIFLKSASGKPVYTETEEPAYLYQTVRGLVLDAASKQPLIGASIRLLDDSEFKGTATDFAGRFELSDVQVGRRSFEVSYVGYYPMRIKDLVIISGKEMVLNIEMQESVMELSEIVVSSQIDKITPLNEMVAVSARSFSVEETSRYAASFLDPARMARTFAGVSYLDDLENHLVVRGNGPTSLLWRLEGVEIPNPNHYADVGSSSGAISMLSSNTLANSEFLLGAFPAEYGNTISGVFDLRLRKGNRERRESSFMLGALGLEASTEGPFRKGGRSSYLINYRYSSIDILDKIGLNPVQTGGVPRYQDLTFKLHFPGKKNGYWSLFGLAGKSLNRVPAVLRQRQNVYLRFEEENENFRLGMLGLTNFYSFSETIHLKTILLASANKYEFLYAAIDTMTLQPWLRETEDYFNADYRLSAQLNWKYSPKLLFRAGFIWSGYNFNLKYRLDHKRRQYEWDFLDHKGQTASAQLYTQFKYRPNEKWTFQAGWHQLYFLLNNHITNEPRLSVQWQFAPRRQLAFGLGKHSFLGHVSAYLFDAHPAKDTLYQPFRQAEFPKSLHAVLSYDWLIKDNLRLKLEGYYQKLYNIAVSIDPEKSWISIVNAVNNYEIFNSLLQDTIVNSGRGRNIGLELTFEQFFTNDRYFMLTASLYDSRYQTVDGRYFDTRFNGNFIVNLLGGKEFKINENNWLGINGKAVAAGGNRFSPIDLKASNQSGFAVYNPDRINSRKAKTYSRFDFSINYTINRPKVTHTFQLEIQNIFNRKNILEKGYNRSTQTEEDFYQVGLLPNLFYRISL